MIALGLLLVLGFAQSAAAQLAAAAGNPPLTFENNFFVTGDYVVAGAYGMTTNFTNLKGTTYAVGTMNVPDLKNPFTGATNTGNTGVTSVPAGAEVLTALLYWQSVEKVGQPGTGQNGFFRAVNGGAAAPGYAITGVDITTHSTVSFSNGGCSGGSTGKLVKTYRAAVTAYLPQDPNTGIVLPNTTYQVLLPSTGSTTPITLGATLVIIYRIL